MSGESRNTVRFMVSLYHLFHNPWVNLNLGRVMNDRRKILQHCWYNYKFMGS